MKALILGCGNVGLQLGLYWKHQGHWVAGTTTTEKKIPLLEKTLDRSYQLKGNELDKIRQAAEGVDVLVVSVAPPVGRSTTPEQRREVYHQVLVETCRNAALSHDRCVFLSSFSVCLPPESISNENYYVQFI